MSENCKKLIARWTITADLEMETVSQIGSHEADNCDQTYESNEEGKLLLHGSTQAGALRSALMDRLLGYRQVAKSEEKVKSNEDRREREAEDAVDALFGHEKKHESPVILFDSIAMETGGASIRDGVRINPTNGIADGGYKYDREVSLPGIVFPFRCDLLIEPQWDEKVLLSHIASALDALTEGAVRFGARKSRGMGAIKASSFRAFRYDLTQADGWIQYSTSAYTLTPLTPTVTTAETPQEAIARVLGEAIDLPDDQRERCVLGFDLNLDSTLLIRSPGQESGSADVIHLKEGDQAVLSGTSFAGAIRAQCRRILSTLSHRDKGEQLESLFGSEPQKGQKNLVASRIRFSEGRITGERSYRQTRVKIDRFTGSPIDTALFEEQPTVGGRTTIEAEIRNPTGGDIALLALAARDLLEGLFTLGGEASVGRGLVSGSVRITLPDERGEVKLEAIPDRYGARSVIIDRPELLQPFLNELITPKEKKHEPDDNQ